MLTLTQIFISVFIIIAIAIIIIIFEWIRLESLSTQLLQFERDIEKKTQEFDSFRKQRASIQCYHNDHTIFPQTSIETQQSFDNSDQIQIMRNVGGTFKDSSQMENELQANDALTDNIFDQAMNSQQSTTQHHQDYSIQNSINTTNIINENQYYAGNQPENTPVNSMQNRFVQNQDVNNQYTSDYKNAPPYYPQDKYDNNETVKFATPKQEITLYLYSDALKDADFGGIWKKLVDYLSSGSPVAVKIDFSGIHFVYEKEIKYLEDMLMYLERFNGTLKIINCDQDVITLMKNHPKLLSGINEIIL